MYTTEIPTTLFLNFVITIFVHLNVCIIQKKKKKENRKRKEEGVHISYMAISIQNTVFNLIILKGSIPTDIQNQAT